MAWTREDKIRSLMRLPWTVRAEPSGDPGELVVRVTELPGTVVIGTKEEIETEFWPALRATFECLLDFEDKIPLPAGVVALPWEARRTSGVHQSAETAFSVPVETLVPA